MDGRGMGAHGGGGGDASGAQRAQRTMDFGASARAVRLGGRGSIRWRRCGRARSSRLISRRQIPGARVAAADAASMEKRP
jgi:hypothetical protein